MEISVGMGNRFEYKKCLTGRPDIYNMILFFTSYEMNHFTFNTESMFPDPSFYLLYKNAREIR